jgi:hypothetical protein
MIKPSSQKVIILSADKAGGKKFLDICSKEKIHHWIYLGKNVSTALEIERCIGSSAHKIEIGKELQKNAQHYRQEYIDFIGQCSVEAGSHCWYLTSLSEKNPFVSDFYLNFCYLKSVLHLLPFNTGTIGIFCESSFLMNSLEVNLEKKTDWEAEVYRNHLDEHLITVFSYVKAKKRMITFLSRFFSRILISRIFRMIRGKEPISPGMSPFVAIHSWVDLRSFSLPARYTDIYFGDLGKKIEENQQGHITIFNILPTIFYPSAVQKLIRAGTPGFLFEEFLDFSDILRAWHHKPALKKKMNRQTAFSQCDVSDLMVEEYRHDLCSTRAEQSLLWYHASEKICRRLNLSVMVYTFENHIWEKMFVLGIRKYGTPVKLVGYAHATVNPMELSYSVSHLDRNRHPLPDTIAVNGCRAKEVLINSGFQEDQIAIFGSLRYENIRRQTRDGSGALSKRILIVLSADISRSLEMIDKTRTAFACLEGVFVILKLHPTMKNTSLGEALKKLPENFSIASQSISDIINTLDLVIYSDSTAAVEVAVGGVPLLHMKSDYSIDINVFEGVCEVPSVNSPVDIRTTALAILSNRDYHQPECQDIANELFSQVNPAVIHETLFSK